MIIEEFVIQLEKRTTIVKKENLPVLNYKITHWAIKEEFVIQVEEGTIIDKERKD